MKISIPMRLRSPLNGPQGRTRGAQLMRAAERKNQRLTVRYHLQTVHYCRVSDGETEDDMRACLDGGGVCVTLTRIAPRRLDGDNLAAALKSVRDGVADWLSVDDGSDLVSWYYAARRGRQGEYAVEIAIETRVLRDGELVV